MTSYTKVALAVLSIVAVLVVAKPTPMPDDSFDREGKLWEILATYKQSLSKRDELLTSLFGKTPAKDWLSMDATITWYSLSVEECDEDPDTAAHGKSRPFMAAISMHLVHALGLAPGDRLAVLSDDGKVAAVVVYWDQKNARYDSGSWIDIVAPSQKVAARWAIRPGRIVKI